MTDENASGLLIAVQGRVGTITLNRPGQRNAITRAMWLGLPGAVARLAAVRVIVLRGAGGDFAAGADIGEFDTVYASRDAATDYAAAMAGAMDALLACGKPVIAAIEGFCIGGGVALTLCCDFSFADAGARFAITPARLGIAYSFADTRRLVARIGAAAAKDFLFSARRIDAAEALRMGLVDRVFVAGTLDAEVAGYAEVLAGNSAASQRVAKDFVARATAGQVAEDAATRAAYLDILEGPDFQEGRRAFSEKRKPDFGSGSLIDALGLPAGVEDAVLDITPSRDVGRAADFD
jgi:enoyl-CoA hydratase/carnithine racemase